MAIRKLLLAVVMFFLVNVSPAQAQSKSDAYCLALTAFTEARGDGEHGMALVVHTVLNRMVTRKKTACQVVHAPWQYNGVQFWPKGLNPIAIEPTAWHTATKVTQRVVAGKWDFGACKGAEYFFAPAEVKRLPRWARVLPYKCSYRGHKFYGTA